ncbi:CopD family protein [bacterium]|nr:CopD family protein [bacterium]
MSYLIFKSVHVIAVVSWFAGLFYLGRLFVYLREAHDAPDPDNRILLKQFNLMAKRVWWMILTPASVVSILIGFHLAAVGDHLQAPWMQAKLAMISLLVAYQLLCGRYRRLFATGKPLAQSSRYFRIFNEIPTILLIAIVFLVITKSVSIAVNGVVIAVAVALGIMLEIRFFRKSIRFFKQSKKEDSK